MTVVRPKVTRKHRTKVKTICPAGGILSSDAPRGCKGRPRGPDSERLPFSGVSWSSPASMLCACLELPEAMVVVEGAAKFKSLPPTEWSDGRSSVGAGTSAVAFRPVPFSAPVVAS